MLLRGMQLDRRHASVYRNRLPGDIGRGVRSEQHSDTFQIFVPTKPFERGEMHDGVVVPFGHRLRHLGRKHAGGNRIYRDVVACPFRRERPCEVDHAAFAGVVCNGAHEIRMRPRQPGDGCDVDNPTVAGGNHRQIRRGLRQCEDGRQVEVDDLVPGIERMLLSRRTPGGARIVDQDVEPAVSHQDLLDEQLRRVRILQIIGDCGYHNAHALEVRSGLVQLGLLAGGDYDFRTHLSECFGDLETEPTRATRNQGHATGQVEQLFDAHLATQREEGRVQTVPETGSSCRPPTNDLLLVLGHVDCSEQPAYRSASAEARTRAPPTARFLSKSWMARADNSARSNGPQITSAMGEPPLAAWAETSSST